MNAAAPAEVAIAAIRAGWAVELAAESSVLTVGVANVRAEYHPSGRLTVARLPTDDGAGGPGDSGMVIPREHWRAVIYTRDGSADAVIDAIGAAVVLLGDGSTAEVDAPPSASH